MSDILKGGLRGLLADSAGAPVDLATLLTNLGIAGTGYLAHKLRMIDQPPDLIDPKDVPFSSDWHVKNSPLEDPGTGKYTAGRFTGNLAPLFAAAAARVKPPVKGQTNALYPGGNKELLLQTNAYPESLMYGAEGTEPNKLTPELYHLSAAIRNRPQVDRTLRSAGTLDGGGFGSVTLLPNPAKLEPRVSPTVIKNRDFWSPRRADSRAQGDPRDFLSTQARWRKDAADHPGKFAEDVEKNLKERNRFEALLRLSDRFVTTHESAGVRGEGRGDLDYLREMILPKYRERLDLDPVQDGVHANKIHHRMMMDSPRFQSFKHYENSPAGAKTLGTHSRIQEMSQALENRIIDFFHGRVTSPEFEPRMPTFAYSLESLEALLKSGTLKGSELAEAQNLRKAVRQFPSAYAETKTFGALPLNKETIAGAYLERDSDAANTLAKLLRAKGIPTETRPIGTYPVEDIFPMLEDMQTYALKRK